MKSKIFMILTVLLFSFAYVFLCSRQAAWPLGSEIVLPGPGPQNWKEIKARTIYHGVYAAEMIDGKWYFWRKEKKYKLW